MSYVEKTHRFGLLTPSSNTIQEPEFSAVLPRTVSLHTGRVAYRDITPQEQMRCVLELESESRKLADAEVDVIVFAATAPTLAKGKGYDRELIKPPGVAETLDWARALQELGARDLDLETAAASLGVAVKYREDAERVRASLDRILSR